MSFAPNFYTAIPFLIVDALRTDKALATTATLGCYCHFFFTLANGVNQTITLVKTFLNQFMLL